LRRRDVAPCIARRTGIQATSHRGPPATRSALL